jgi:hypothetical protein
MEKYMVQVKKIRIIVLRIFYVMVGSGFAFLSFVEPVFNQIGNAALESVLKSVLLAAALLAFIGVVQPIKVLPLLFLSVFWKSILLALFIAPSYFSGALDLGLQGFLLPFFIGYLVTIMVIPWKYVISNFFTLKVGA